MSMNNNVNIDKKETAASAEKIDKIVICLFEKSSEGIVSSCSLVTYREVFFVNKVH